MIYEKSNELSNRSRRSDQRDDQTSRLQSKELEAVKE